ncbi:hypothetical protein WJ970_23700 [Achromobacter xylosoxidans]
MQLAGASHGVEVEIRAFHRVDEGRRPAQALELPFHMPAARTLRGRLMQ